jgi:hypothetical protein
MKRLLLIVSLLCAVPLFASTKTWTGAAGSNWSDGGNWSDGTAPAAGDDLVFGPAPPHQHIINDLPAGTAFHSIAFTGPYFVTGNPFGVSAGITSSGKGIGGLGGVTVSLLASQTWSGALPVGAVDLGPYTLTLNTGPNGSPGLGGVISGSGGIVVNGSTALSGTNTYTGPTIVNAQGWLNCYCWLPGSVNVAGMLTLSSGSTAVPGVGGALTVAPHGTLDLEGVGAKAGSLTLAEPSRLVVTVPEDARASLSVAGAVSLGNANLHVFNLPYPAPDGASFPLIAGTSPPSGTFAELPEGGRVTPTEKVSYRGGSGNDVTLTKVPEPISRIRSSARP